MGISRLLLLVAAFACLAFGQQPSGQTTPPTGSGETPSTGSATGRTRVQPISPDASIPSTPSQRQPRISQDPNAPSSDLSQRASGLSGKLVPTPGTPVRVDLYVDMIRLDSTFTDANGSFRFTRNVSARRYELHFELAPGIEYVEEVDTRSNYPIIVYVQPHGIRKTGPDSTQNTQGLGTTISLASMLVPKNAAKEFEKAHKLAQQNKFAEALPRLRRATEIYPKYAEAFNEIGRIQGLQNHPEEARTAFEQAISADPEWVQAYVNLAALQMNSNQIAQLLETSNRILSLDPALGLGHFFNSVARFSMGQFKAAEKSALEADRSERGRVPQVQLLLARIYQRMGDGAQYAGRLRSYLQENPKAANAEKLRAELQQTEKR